MQKLPIKQDNTTQSPAAMSVGCWCKQPGWEQRNSCRLGLMFGQVMETASFLSAGTLKASANGLSHFLIWLPPAANPSTLCLLCMFIRSVLNCERPAKCIPLAEDRLKTPAQIAPGFVFYLFPLLIISEQSDFTVLSLELALHLQSYRRMWSEGGSVLKQAEAALDG